MKDAWTARVDLVRWLRFEARSEHNEGLYSGEVEPENSIFHMAAEGELVAIDYHGDVWKEAA